MEISMSDVFSPDTALVAINGHRTLEERTYQQLRTAIARGTLEPGARLVGSQLAATLGVSRITVANAIKRLASEGFVLVTPHKEAHVASLDRARIDEMRSIRHALEEFVLKAAAEHISSDAIAHLKEIDANLCRSCERGDLAKYRAYERQFHLGIYEAAHLPLTTAILIDLWDRFEPYRMRRFVITGLRNANYAEHEGIIAALEAHDGDALVKVMRAHVQGGYDRTIEALWPHES
jgi:DNA-binding GntR family transcriptional regulator